MKKLKIGKKSGLRYFDIEDIRSWGPCYDPNRHLDETFRGTALDILNNKNISIPDRLWVVLRPSVLSDKVMRLFAVWSYRQTLVFLPNQDPRSIEAANVAARFANGEATEQERAAYASAASAAYASSACSASAASAASAAYACSASAASGAYACSASAASASAASAAYAAYACSAYASAAPSASSACAASASAASAAETNAREAQLQKLIEMVIAEGKERVNVKK